MRVSVLYVDTPAFTGGAEISLLTLMRHLDPARYVPLLVTGGEGQLAQTAREHGIETFIQDFPWFRKRYPWRYPASITRLAMTMRRHKVALVHTNCDHSPRYVLRACQLARLPYVAHVRDFVRTWFEPHNLRALNRAAVVLANSQAVASACAEAGIEPARIRTVYNPIDLAPFQQLVDADRQPLRSSLGLPADAFVVGIVGQIQPIKGHIDFVSAAAQVVASVPQAHFVVAGDAMIARMQAFKEQLQQAITDNGLSDRFHFLGFRNDLPVVMRSLDVLVAPSWSESFGRVVVEGQSAGCPVVGTNVGGIPEIIQDGVNGLLAPPHDPTSLAAAIVRLGTDATLRAELRAAGLRSAQRFNIQRHVEQMQSIYDEVVKLPGSNAGPATSPTLSASK